MAKKSSWNGDAQLKRVRDAQRRGVDKTMSQAAQHAKDNHDQWQNRTGTLEGGIRIYQFAILDGGRVRGLWGVADVVYARRMELGFDGEDSAGRAVSQPPRPFLRPAADATYRNLPANIKEFM